MVVIKYKPTNSTGWRHLVKCWFLSSNFGNDQVILLYLCMEDPQLWRFPKTGEYPKFVRKLQTINWKETLWGTHILGRFLYIWKICISGYGLLLQVKLRSFFVAHADGSTCILP